jgi:hypothetical protein
MVLTFIPSVQADPSAAAAPDIIGAGSKEEKREGGGASMENSSVGSQQAEPA